MPFEKGTLPAELPLPPWEYCAHSLDDKHLAAGNLAGFGNVSIWCTKNQNGYCVRRVFSGERELTLSEYNDSGLAPKCNATTLEDKLPVAPDLEGCTHRYSTCDRRRFGLQPRCNSCSRI